MTTNFSRRYFIKGALSATCFTSLVAGGFYGKVIQALGNAKTIEMFKYGVSSGDPTHSSLVLWTKVESVGCINVLWELSSDSDFKQIVQRGKVITDGAINHSVKVEVVGLNSGATYYYRFNHQGVYSEPGRTKTLAKGSLEQLGIAVVSCSNYPFGYFNVYDAIARDEDIDFVLHLGDYIYEYGEDGWGAESGRELDRSHEPAHEIVSLQDYRQRHAQYKSEKASRLMHSMHPLIPIWDDHESANNPWKNGAQNHQKTEGLWQDRRANSVKAYYEWMPIRDPKNKQDKLCLWRHFIFGDLASLTTLETRHTGRSLQLDYADHLNNIKNVSDRNKFMSEVLGDKERQMLSTEMQDFFVSGMKQSKEQQAWRLVGNQIPMARMHVPKIQGKFKSKESKGYDPVADAHKRFERLGELDLPIYLDTWDGYQHARESFYQATQEAGVSDLLVLTGDSHSFWANQLFDQLGRSMGVELGTAGVTSPGDFESYGHKTATILDNLMIEHNREIIWTDCQHRGFIKLILNHKEARADYIAVDTVNSTEYKKSTIKRANITNQGGVLTSTLLDYQRISRNGVNG